MARSTRKEGQYCLNQRLWPFTAEGFFGINLQCHFVHSIGFLVLLSSHNPGRCLKKIALLFCSKAKHLENLTLSIACWNPKNITACEICNSNALRRIAPVPKLSILREWDKHSCKMSHISNVGMLSTLSNITQSYFALWEQPTKGRKEGKGIVIYLLDSIIQISNNRELFVDWTLLGYSISSTKDSEKPSQSENSFPDTTLVHL